ncbi:hypothetical protein BDZ89DRAFT_1142284 [Hymenopellis radicata]|nr:hypothetical protein BDZ89DRAFT_1142284 [Hymenopellis radicata]
MDIFNNEELQAANPRWNPDEWISRGRSYHDVPRYVNLELARVQVIPSTYQDLLPPDAHSQHNATDILPTPSNITTIEIPPFATILRLENALGQAWLDGATSIRDSRTSQTQYLPLWYLTMMRSFWHACKSAAIWSNAFVWLHDGSPDAEEEVLRSRAMACASSVIGWHGPAKTLIDDVHFEFVAEIVSNSAMGQVARYTLLEQLLPPQSQMEPIINPPSAAIIF